MPDAVLLNGRPSPMKRLALNSGEIIRRHRVLTTMAAVLAIVIYVKTTALLVGGALVEFRTPASVMGTSITDLIIYSNPSSPAPGMK